MPVSRHGFWSAMRAAALAIAAALLVSNPAAAQFGGVLGVPQPAAEEPSGPGGALAEQLEKSLAEGAEIIVIRPGGGGEPAPGAEASGGFDGGGVGDIEDYRRLAAGDGLMVEMARTELETLYLALMDRIRQAPRLRDEMIRLLDQKSPTGEAGYFLDIVLETVGYLAIATISVILIFGVLILRPWFIRQKSANPTSIEEKLPLLLLRAALGLCGIFLAVGVAMALGLVFGRHADHEPTQNTVLIVFGVYVAIRLVAIGWRVVLAPYLSEYRIPRLTDGEARRLFVWLLGTGAIALIFQSFCVWMDALGLPGGFHAIVTSGLTLGIVGLNTLFVLFNNRTVARAIRGGKAPAEATWPARWAGALWGPAVILYSIAAWAVMTAQLLRGEGEGVPLIVGAYAILLSAFGVYGVVSAVISRIFSARRTAAQIAPPAAETAESPAGSVEDVDAEAPIQRRFGRMRTAKDLGRRIATILAMSAGAYAFVRIWRADVETMAEAPWLDGLIDISVTLLLGYIAYHGLRIWIDQRIEEEGGFDDPEPGEGEGGSGASRLATLLPLFRNFILAMITITVILIVALELGVNVAPLFAGAGILGLALGFGAQALVRDILSGAFFLIDDAFRKGEYVDLGTVKGVVERISVRSFQLRHHLGYLHTVPFGEIQSLTNYSRDWVVMKLPLRLTYDTDAEAVRKKIKKLGQELLEDPVHGPKFMQPLKSQGLIQMEDSAMIMRVKFMTKPGEQWVLRKVILAKIRDLFEREGIRFAHREVTVRVAEGGPGHTGPGGAAAPGGGGSQNLTEDQKRAIAGAAAPSLAQRQESIGDDPFEGGGD